MWFKWTRFHPIFLPWCPFENSPAWGGGKQRHNFYMFKNFFPLFFPTPRRDSLSSHQNGKKCSTPPTGPGLIVHNLDTLAEAINTIAVLYFISLWQDTTRMILSSLILAKWPADGQDFLPFPRQFIHLSDYFLPVFSDYFPAFQYIFFDIVNATVSMEL